MSVPLVNIGGNKNDKYHRYKRELLQVRQENVSVIVNAYAKTQIINLHTVSDQIGRPLDYIIKYLSSVLGTQTNYDKANHLFKLNGQYTTDELEAHLEKFIALFVLCKSCGNPETSVKVEGKDTVKLKCAACGKVTRVDPTEKLTNFIAKNPPKVNKMATASTVQPTEEERIFSTDDNWNPETDTSEEAVAKRREAQMQLGFGVQDVEEEKEETRVTHPTELLSYFVENMAQGDQTLVYKAALKIRDQYHLNKNELVCLVFESIFTRADFLDTLQEWKDLLSNVVSSTQQQVVFLRNLRRLCRKYPNIIDKLAAIFEKLYDFDLIDEDVFLQWNKKESQKEDDVSVEMVKAVSAFIQWLKGEDEKKGSDDDASDDDDSDDDDDDDDDSDDEE